MNQRYLLRNNSADPLTRDFWLGGSGTAVRRCSSNAPSSKFAIGVSCRNKRSKEVSPPFGCKDCGEDAYFIEETPSTSFVGMLHLSPLIRIRLMLRHMCGVMVAGVCDGVGGWIMEGVDPALFSRGMVKQASAVVRSFNTSGEKPQLPNVVLDRAYEALMASGEVEKGEKSLFRCLVLCLISF